MQPQESIARIVVTEEGRPERTIEVGEVLTIGRSPGNGLVLEDQQASRRHAEIRRLGAGRYALQDAGSANGTWVNGRRLAASGELRNGDVISIGNARLRFFGPVPESVPEALPEAAMGAGTDLYFRNETAVILVADIRNYTRMSEVLPAREFSLVITDWFKESSDTIEQRGGTVDKFIGDAVMAYWLVREPDRPAPEVDEALRAARALIEKAAAFEQRLSGRFPGQAFRIGIGVNLGEAVVGNVGGGAHQSFTIVGDSVNVTFRLESLTKEKGCPVVVSHRVTEHASAEFRFSDLGRAEVKGRSEPVSIWALEI